MTMVYNIRDYSGFCVSVSSGIPTSETPMKLDLFVSSVRGWETPTIESVEDNFSQFPKRCVHHYNLENGTMNKVQNTEIPMFQ
jgi:hypothetical protein